MNNIGTGKNFPKENPGILDRALTYAIINFGVVPAIQIFMNLLNQTRIIGREHLRSLNPPFILMSNHLTLLDDLFLGPLLFFPKTLKGYEYIPYHAPEENNFYKIPLISWFMRKAKSIPLIRGRGVNQEGVSRLISAVKNGGMLHIYPEGTRSRDGEIGKPKLGVGRIVCETGTPVLPVYHQGLERILPIGAKSIGFGREIRIAIGEPLYFEKELKMNNNIRTWRAITDRIMDSIHQQRAAANARWGFKPVRVKLIRSTKTVQQ